MAITPPPPPKLRPGASKEERIRAYMAYRDSLGWCERANNRAISRFCFIVAALLMFLLVLVTVRMG